MQNLKLTFENNEFKLCGKKNQPRILSVKEAFSYKSLSDEKAFKVFDRALFKYYNAPPLPNMPFLDEHQTEGIKWILSRNRSYLAHAPGAGKTAQAIIASNFTLTKGQTLFIVPPSLTVNWFKEIVKFSNRDNNDKPLISIVPLTNEKHTMNWDAEFIICSDSLLTRPWVYGNLLKRDLKFLAVDEASRFKEPTSKRSLALYGGKISGKYYPGLIQKPRHTVFLDGSPMPNRPIELWAPLYSLDPASINFMSYDDFGMRYGNPTFNKFSKKYEYNGSSNEQDLKNKLKRNLMHVVGEEKLTHPERLRSVVFVNEIDAELQTKSWDLYLKYRKKIESPSDELSQGELASHRQDLGMSKLLWSAKYIKERLENKSESILVFAWHRSVCEGLSNLLHSFDPRLIIGGVSNAYREKAFTDFQLGKTRLIIGNIQAMGRGHNLQKANRVIFAEYSWTDELNLQCEKRASRRGSNNTNVRCEYICIPDSLDEVILNSVLTKQKRVKEIIG